jgi:hypothetical protein
LGREPLVKLAGLLSQVRSGSALIGCLLVCACGAAASASPSPTLALTTPTATATPTPSPTPNLTATAAYAYLAAATTANAADAAINKAYPTNFTSLAQARRYWAQEEAVDRTFLTKIFGIAYPAFMKADVDAQISAETKLVADETSLASTPNDTVAGTAARADGTTEAAAANIVRHDLGLPQVPLS